MHTCPPPIDALNDWLSNDLTTSEGFGHLLLEQYGSGDASLIDALRPYFESAHADAREVIHAYMGIDLHPDMGYGTDVGVTYPGSLPSKARRGLFGEVLAGLITEAYKLIGQHAWTVPVFLFRNHDDARNYLFDLARNPAGTRQTLGRLGSDFIGIAVDEEGAVTRVISGESKWRLKLSQSVVDTLMLGSKIPDPANPALKIRDNKGVWNAVNTDSSPPTGLRQLQRILEEKAPEKFDAAIFSMQRALLLRNPEPLPQLDLIVIAGNAPSSREAGTCSLPFDGIPEEYTAGNDLQLVEVYLNSGEEIIEALYDSLWNNEAE
jgi:hypothetical protein